MFHNDQTGVSHQVLNPLDRLFLVADRVLRRAGLSGARLVLVIELADRIDMARLRSAVGAVFTLYPSIRGRLIFDRITGLPCWRHDAPCDVDRFLHLHHLQNHPDASRNAILSLANRRDDLFDGRSIAFHVLRPASGPDVLVLRTPHARVDARGAALFALAVDDLLAGRLTASSSLGDEHRQDFATLTKGITRRDACRALLARDEHAPPRSAATVYLAPHRPPPQLGQLDYVRRELSSDQLEGVNRTALRLCGFGRSVDFVRICAARALCDLTGARDGWITTANLVDLRRRQRGAPPVLWNFTGAAPLTLQIADLHDVGLAADRLRDQMASHVANDAIRRRLAALGLLMQTPTAYLTAAVKPHTQRASGWTPTPRPSLPLGFVGPQFGDTLLGVPVSNYYGFRTVMPDTGFSIEVNLTADRLNITCPHLTSRIPTHRIQAFLDRLVTRLLSGQA